MSFTGLLTLICFKLAYIGLHSKVFTIVGGYTGNIHAYVFLCKVKECVGSMSSS